MRRFLAIAALTLLALGAQPAAAQPPDPGDTGRDVDRAAIRTHIEGICQAFVDGDVTRIRATHTDDWRGFLENSRAPIKGIDEYMRANGIPWPQPAAVPPRAPSSSTTRTFKVSDLDVHFYGPDLAVASFFVDFGDTKTGEFVTAGAVPDHGRLRTPQRRLESGRLAHGDRSRLAGRAGRAARHAAGTDSRAAVHRA